MYRLFSRLSHPVSSINFVLEQDRVAPVTHLAVIMSPLNCQYTSPNCQYTFTSVYSLCFYLDHCRKPVTVKITCDELSTMQAMSYFINSVFVICLILLIVDIVRSGRRICCTDDVSVIACQCFFPVHNFVAISKHDSPVNDLLQWAPYPGICENAGNCHCWSSMVDTVILLKGLVLDWGQCLFTKNILHVLEFFIEFLQKVIQKCTKHFEKD